MIRQRQAGFSSSSEPRQQNSGVCSKYSGDAADGPSELLVNDAQSKLNLTRVKQVFYPESIDQISDFVKRARVSGDAISVSGGKHAMGGQQFGNDNFQFDMSGFNRILNLDRERGLVTVESGIQWPQLIQELHRLQNKNDTVDLWTIKEKQSGVDSVSIGGSLSSNIHGRGLCSRPFVESIESFILIDHLGHAINCSRDQNKELFSLVIGGYGLFGIIGHVTLRLVRRFKVQRKVEITTVGEALALLEQRRESGFVFGDCQFGIDLNGPAEFHPAIVPCYRPVDPATAITESKIGFTPEKWACLYQLSRNDKRQAFELFAQHYLQTDGQVYWSDTHQLSNAFCGYRSVVDPSAGTEIITEVYVDPERAVPFLAQVRSALVARKADLTYGTIRLIEADEETFLPWARRQSVCVVVNLHCPRTPGGIEKTKRDFQVILDHAIEFDGSFYLTYHRWALNQHMLAAYPNIREFFKLKKRYDPTELFQSDWYRHYSKI